MKEDDITILAIETCNRLKDTLVAIAGRVATRDTASFEENEVARATRLAIEQIKAKEFISPAEAALLFGCSAQHLRNLVQRAQEGKATYPIPFRDLDGVVTFPVSELLEWSRVPKPRIRKASSKNKRGLRALAS